MNALLPLLLAGSLVASTVHAESALVRPDDARRGAERVPLPEAFPRWEQGLILGTLLLDAGLVLGGRLGGGREEPTFADPGPDSLDRRISEHFAGGQHDPLLAGWPDRGAWVYTLLPVALYGSSAVVDRARQGGRGWMGEDDVNPHLRLTAYAEAVATTLLINQTVKLTVGRTRPRNALYDDPAPDDPERNLSFFSMHTALTCTAASFLALDLGRDWPLAGRLALGTGLYGLAGLVGYSRIHDQAHYFSDVLVGALVGIASGNAMYLLHFRTDGRPRRGGTPEATAEATAGGSLSWLPSPAPGTPLMLGYGGAF